jgi:chromosome partitioning protein
MRTVAVVNLKGGSGKTTTAVFLAHEWAARGRSVLLVDADPQGTALRWSEQAGFSVSTLALPVKDLHTRLGGIAGDRYDLVVIDTPPLAERAGIVLSALRLADLVLVPLAPTMAEFERLGDVWSSIADVEPLRREPAEVAVLLNRTVANASSTEMIREAIAAGTGGWPARRVLEATVPRREALAQAFGAEAAPGGPYAAVVDELDRVEAAA